MSEVGKDGQRRYRIVDDAAKAADSSSMRPVSVIHPSMKVLQRARHRRSRERRRLTPGARLIREWSGRTHVIDVIEGGYVFESKVYPSLTAIAGKITGARWSGVLRAMSVNARLSPAIRSPQPRLRCAIYTRKYTEEGLEQEFNSLDAQREACAAFIASQVGLGWKLVPDRYDDGGISGGTMERPALRRLLQDIRDRKIDVVVVYKIDRLTRSLADFAKIVDVFDGNGVSLVSVTQQFNTTTSMGRLTLNVLLSFAQFEREVTVERIRDKIAASRKKGMWMGGTVPLGYRVQDRKLLINQPDASFVRDLFSRYLELKSVPKLAREVSRQAAAASDTQAPGSICDRYRARPMFPGMFYKLLVNPIYIGKVRHKGEIYDGEHEPLIDVDLFEAVRKQLTLGAPVPKGTAMHRDTHLLTGILFDDTRDRMSPTHGKANARRYRYYVSSRVRKSRAHIYLDRLNGPSAMNTTSIAQAFNVDRADVGRILPLAFLSPKMLDAILTGSQLASLTPRHLVRTELPIVWTEQDSVLQ